MAKALTVTERAHAEGAELALAEQYERPGYRLCPYSLKTKRGKAWCKGFEEVARRKAKEHFTTLLMAQPGYCFATVGDFKTAYQIVGRGKLLPWDKLRGYRATLHEKGEVILLERTMMRKWLPFFPSLGSHIGMHGDYDYCVVR